MSSSTQLSRCASFIEAVAQKKNDGHTSSRKPSITISRQVGARGTSIGSLLQKRLRELHPEANWTLFDKDLIRKVLEDHNLPQQLENYMPEGKVNELQSLIEEIVGLHPPHWELFEKMSKTIVRLLHQGHVIVVGRGACILAPDRRRALNVRLVGSPQRRIDHLVAAWNWPHEKAARFVAEQDAARRAYMKNYFNEDVDNPLLYDLTINTDNVRDEVAVETIIAALASKQRA